MTFQVSQGRAWCLPAGLEEVASTCLWSPRWRQQLASYLELLWAVSCFLGVLTGIEVLMAVPSLSSCTSQ